MMGTRGDTRPDGRPLIQLGRDDIHLRFLPPTAGVEARDVAEAVSSALRFL
jgi:hypothetical protein